MGHNTSIKDKRQDGELTLQHTTTDSPILPVPQILELHAVLPERVEFVFEQTKLEAEHRRRQESRVNIFILFERCFGSVLAFAVVCLALWTSYLLAMADKQIVASVVVGATLATVVGAFIAGRSTGDQKAPRPASGDKTNVKPK